MANQLSEVELEAYLDEALSPARMAEIESTLREHPEMALDGSVVESKVVEHAHEVRVGSQEFIGPARLRLGPRLGAPAHGGVEDITGGPTVVVVAVDTHQRTAGA